MAKTKRCPICYRYKTINVWEKVASDEISVTCENREKSCSTCKGTGEVPITNADRIRAMSDEELFAFIKNIANYDEYCGCCPANKLCQKIKGESCDEIVSIWLKQPAEEEKSAEDEKLEATSAILESGKCPFPKKVCPKHYSCSRCIEETLQQPAEEEENV